MLDQLSETEYKLEMAVHSYYWDARHQLFVFMGDMPSFKFMDKLEDGLKIRSSWAYDFCEEAGLSDYEIAGLKGDKAMIADLMYQDKEASY
jgi:hypothetical protein